MFVQNWLYSDKLVVFGKIGCIRANYLYSDKMVVFGQNGSIQSK